jgi:hypothetical protein
MDSYSITMYRTRVTAVIAMTFLLTVLSVVSVDPLLSDADASTPRAQELAECASLYPVESADYQICIGQIGTPNVPQN